MTERAVSPVVGYVMTLSVATLLIGSLLIGTGSFVNDHRERSAEGELRVVGQQISGDVAAADRLSRTDSASEVEVGRQHPQRVVGSAYRVHVRDDGEGPTEPYLELSTTEIDVTVQVGLTAESPVSGTAYGGHIQVHTEEGVGLVIRNA